MNQTNLISYVTASAHCTFGTGLAGKVSAGTSALLNWIGQIIGVRQTDEWIYCLVYP